MATAGIHHRHLAAKPGWAAVATPKKMPTAPEVSSPRPPASLRRRRLLLWFLSATALVLMPKCIACLAAYLAIVAGAGWFGAEFCGSVRSDVFGLFPAGAAPYAGTVGAIVFGVLIMRWRHTQRHFPHRTGTRRPFSNTPIGVERTKR